MLSVDTNLLFEACESSTARHLAAVEFLREHGEDRQFAVCELVLVELYVLLRNPLLSRKPLTPAAAAELVQSFRTNRAWKVVDYPGGTTGVADQLWAGMARPNTSVRAIFAVRLALTLRHHGVTEFATRNVKDFQGFGFKRVWDPL